MTFTADERDVPVIFGIFNEGRGGSKPSLPGWKSKTYRATESRRWLTGAEFESDLTVQYGRGGKKGRGSTWPI